MISYAFRSAKRSWPVHSADAVPRTLVVAFLFLLQLTGSTFAATGKLTVRVLDEATGQVIPARLVLQDSTGSWPGDRLCCTADRWPHIEAHGIFIDGEQAFDLPVGETKVTAAHGLEYHAASRTVDVEAGKTILLELSLRRAVDMSAAGWVSGDLHVHMIHGENQRPTGYDDVATSCAANGLDFVSVGQEYAGAGTLDLAGYQVECRRVSTGSFQMFLGAERPQNLLGHQVLLGIEDPFTIPDDAPYFEAARAIHARGGVVVYVHPVRYYPGKQYRGEWLDFPGNNLARELIFDACLGPSFDGLSVLSDEPANDTAHRLWFNLLNRGYFVPVFADSDACFDRPSLGLKVPGFWATYFYIGPNATVTPAALAEATRHGRTIATSGPLLKFDIDGRISGDTLAPDGATRTVTINAHYPQDAFSLAKLDSKTGKPIGISRVELIRNGAVVKQWKPHATEAAITHTLAETENCWYVVRAFGTNEQWQVALTSPIYFAPHPVPAKRPPFTTRVRGRIYDFTTGQERAGDVEVRRGGTLLHRFQAEGQFQVKMPLDAQITVTAVGARPVSKNLLMDYGPVHHFLWYLEASDFGKPETLDMFEHLVSDVELEFPLGYRMPGCYVAQSLAGTAKLNSVRVLTGPETVSDGTAAIAAVLTDAEQIAPGDTLHVAAVFRDEGSAASCGPLVIEARGYDPSRPTGFGALKKCASIEATWQTAQDLGNGYKLLAGALELPNWIEPGPTGSVDLSVRVRKGSGDAAFVGLTLPLGPTRRALTLSNSWPTMPLSWPDRSYGIGPLKVCNRIGRSGQPFSDYRTLRLAVQADGEEFDLLPSRDGRGCADSDDAVYTSHFLDQTLSDQSHLAQPDPVRPQPAIQWRSNVPLIEVKP